MQKFLAIYLGTPDGMSEWNKLDAATQRQREQAGMKAWGDWMAQHKAAIVDSGGPLGRTKHTDKRGVSDVRNAMVGYLILKAESHAAAAQMFVNHPHFMLFPGESVEIMECLPMPGQ